VEDFMRVQEVLLDSNKKRYMLLDKGRNTCSACDELFEVFRCDRKEQQYTKNILLFPKAVL
jgi:hypothetical protein